MQISSVIKILMNFHICWPVLRLLHHFNKEQHGKYFGQLSNNMELVDKTIYFSMSVSNIRNHKTHLHFSYFGYHKPMVSMIQILQ